MLELRLVHGWLLKNVVEAIKELVNDAYFDFSANGLSLQARDSSHVALVTLFLRSEGFQHYRCDRDLSLGMNLNLMSNALEYAGDDDIITIKANDGSDTVNLIRQSPTPKGEIYDLEMKLKKDIDSEHLGIPKSEYHAIVRMPSADFAKICEDLSKFGDTVVISVPNRDGVEFFTRGDMVTTKVKCPREYSAVKPEEATLIEMNEPVSLRLSLRYMNSFTKATPLSNRVTISLSNDLSVVEYKIGEMGYVRFYLATQEEDKEETNASSL